MSHELIRATIIPEIIQLIAQKHQVNENKAMDMFYSSSIAYLLSEDETGLYGQSPLYIFSLFEEEIGGEESEQGGST